VADVPELPSDAVLVEFAGREDVVEECSAVVQSVPGGFLDRDEALKKAFPGWSRSQDGLRSQYDSLRQIALQQSELVKVGCWNDVGLTSHTTITSK
jgi:hypothetical protein